MNRHLLLSSCAGAAWIVISTTPAGGGGIDMSWNDCVGPATTINQNFRCTGDIDEGYSLILQYKPPFDIPDFVALTATVELQMNDAGAPLSPFWHYEMGGCNRAPIPGVAVFDAIPVSCVKQCVADSWSEGSAGMESFVYQALDGPPSRGRFTIQGFRSEPLRLVGGVNYYAFHLRFNNRNRVPCAGCDQPGHLVFTRLVIETVNGPPLTLLNPDKWGNCATVNGGFPASCTITAPPTTHDGTPCDPVPVRRSSWMLMKTLYR